MSSHSFLVIVVDESAGRSWMRLCPVLAEVGEGSRLVGLRGELHHSLVMVSVGSSFVSMSCEAWIVGVGVEAFCLFVGGEF